MSLYELKLDSTFADSEIAEILRGIELLLTTPIGTIPLDREFGVSIDIVDAPYEATKSLLTAEITSKIETFFPTLRVKAVEWITEMSGGIKPKVVITNGTN